MGQGVIDIDRASASRGTLGGKKHAVIALCPAVVDFVYASESRSLLRSLKGESSPLIQIRIGRTRIVGHPLKRARPARDVDPVVEFPACPYVGDLPSQIAGR